MLSAAYVDALNTNRATSDCQQAVDEAAEVAQAAEDNRTRVSRFMPTSRRIVQACSKAISLCASRN